MTLIFMFLIKSPNMAALEMVEVFASLVLLAQVNTFVLS